MLVTSACSGPGGGVEIDAGVPIEGEPAPGFVQGGDPTFGENGVVTLDFEGLSRAPATAVAQQPDGRLIAAGETNEALFVLRATADGRLDPSFGTGGIVQLPLGPASSDDAPHAANVAITADYKIVAAGSVATAYTTPRDAVFRLTVDGALDASFGSDGRVLVDANIDALALAPDGKVVVSEGSTLVRLDEDGGPDPSFGSAGLVALAGSANAIAVGADGSIVTAGSGVSRYLATGAIDTSFGSGGTLALPYAELYAVALAGDGGVVAGGFVGSGASVPALFAIARTTAAGALDPAFGIGGIASYGTTSGHADGVALTSTGIIAIGGAGSNNGVAGGTLCLMFGSDGTFDSTCALPIDLLLGANGNPLVLPDDSAIIAGRSFLGNGGVAAALMKMTAAGSADTSFGSDGVLAQPVGDGSFVDSYAVTNQADGSVLVAPTLGFWPLRLTPNGALDTAFEITVEEQSEPPDVDVYATYDVEVQGSGSIVIGGPSANQPFTTARFDATGSLDTSFGDTEFGIAEEVVDGFLTESFNQTVAGDGSIYIVGDTIVGATATAHGQPQLVVMHLTADGKEDDSYGSHGVAVSSFSGANEAVGLFVSTGSDGSVIALGATPSPTAIRFDASGTLDSGFAGSGELVFGNPAAIPLGLARQPDGKLLAIAGVGAAGELDVVRFTDDGALDASFGNEGAVELQLGGANDYGLSTRAGLAVDSAGNILVGTAIATSDQLSEQAAIVRLTPEGAFDPSWGPGGVRTYASLSTGPSAIHALHFQPDGKLLAAGRCWTPEGSSDLLVIRFGY